jgi:hypothetical protein
MRTSALLEAISDGLITVVQWRVFSSSAIVRGVGLRKRSAQWGGALGGAFLALVAPACADQSEKPPTQEVWAGADVTSSNWSVYSGMTAALFGGLHDNGWRIRGVGGYGRYTYRGLNQKITGNMSFADGLLGYHQQWGNLTVKLFAGVSWVGHGLSMIDPENGIVGADIGAKLLLESWLEINPRMWASVDVSWSSVHEDGYWTRVRGGYRVLPDLSLGFEAGALGGNDLADARIGLFARFAWDSGEVSLSAGLSDRIDRDPDAYGTLNVLYKF